MIEKVNDVEALYCRNPECPAKAIKGVYIICQPGCDEYRWPVGGNTGEIHCQRFYQEFWGYF